MGVDMGLERNLEGKARGRRRITLLSWTDFGALHGYGFGCFEVGFGVLKENWKKKKIKTRPSRVGPNLVMAEFEST